MGRAKKRPSAAFVIAALLALGLAFVIVRSMNAEPLPERPAPGRGAPSEAEIARIRDACRAGDRAACESFRTFTAWMREAITVPSAMPSGAPSPVAAAPVPGTCGPSDPAVCASAGRARLGDAPEIAADLFRRGCDLHDDPSCAELATLLVLGRGAPPDVPRGVRMLREGCDRGEPTACASLGRLHLAGTGVERDEAKAIRLLKKACDANGAAGCRMLALAYRGGTGVRADETHANELLRRACSLGDRLACNLVE